jgi:WXG100 family type VII secretion target
MANGIAVTPERLREVSAQMSAGAADVDAILSQLAGTVAPLRSEWVGPAQAQFNALWDQLQQDASGVQSVLSGIAKLTQNAAAAYAATEQSIANSFNELRVEMDESSEEVGQVQQILTPTPHGTETVESDVVTEVEEDLIEEDLTSIDPSKVGRRSPWKRFTTSNARPSMN